MQATLPKQFLPLAGEPVLMRTIRCFADYDASMEIMVVLPSAQLETWQQLCKAQGFRIPHQQVAGGETRFQSVKNGLSALAQAPDGVVAVHDGVRPLVSTAILANAFATAHALGSAVVAVSLKDSIRQVTGARSEAVDRNAYRLVQTPQCFRLPLLRRAYEQPESHLFTDDASVVEKFGHRIQLVEGSYRNIKLTTPEDMLLAEVFLHAEPE